MTTLRHIVELCPQIAQAACDLYHRQVSSSRTLARRLVHPYKGTELRCSEQETRILFCEALEAAGFWYSIETPTFRQYRQKGKNDIRARSDLAVYKSIPSANDPVPSVRIELKALGGGITLENLRKDLEKLVREDADGVLFHTSPTVHKKTLPNIISKISDSFTALIDKGYLSSREHSIAIVLCVLERRELWMSELQLKLPGDIARILSAPLDMKAPKGSTWTYHHLTAPVQVMKV